MKPETLIFDKVRKILPDMSDKTIFFVGITKTSQEVYFYSFINGEAVQCYTLAEQYELDENELAEVFSEIVEIIKDSKLYIPDKYNVGTISIDKSGIKLDMGYYDMDASEYRIQKEWKKDKIDSL
ncbi:MAG: DUF600 family protein [Eubacteriales bacterium]|nr:DUF600 family protein [Eubacteriales bacterium]